jgi:hypothetical protein
MKFATIRKVLGGWPVHHPDAKNVFLYDTLTETVYCIKPTRFVDPAHPQLVC